MNTPTAPDPFVPTDFAVPATLETDEFRLRMLTVDDVIKDYDAVLSSADHCSELAGGLENRLFDQARTLLGLFVGTCSLAPP